MKRSLWLGILLSVFCAWPGQVTAQEPAPPVKYFALPFGTVQYAISGAEVGTQTTYFDQWGMRQAHSRKSETPRFGMMLIVTLNLAERTVLMDLDKRLAQKSENAVLKQLLAAYKPEDNVLLSLQVVQNEGGQKVRNETFLDRPCEVWENKARGSKVWLWNGIPLRSETQSPDGLIIVAATKVDETTPVDENVFVLPEGFHFIDTDIKQILLSRR